MSQLVNWRRGALGLGALGVLAAAAACGGGTSATTAGATSGTATTKEQLAAASTLVEQASAAVTDVGAPTSSPPVAKAKSIVVIPCSYAAEGCKRSADAVVEAAGVLGWKAQIIDPAGDPDKMRSAVETAVRLKADGIVLAAVPPAVVKTAVGEARAAGIKIVNTLESPNPLYDASATTDHVAAGRINAAFTAMSSGGKARVVLINDPEFQSVVDWHKGYVDGLKEFCGGCKVVADFDFQIANLQTTVPTQFQATLQAHPDVDFVWTAYDPVSAAIQPVIARSAKPDAIKIVSHNGDPFALKSIQTGGESVVGTVAYPIEWQSYVGMDLMNRLFNGQKPAQTDVNVPNKLMTKTNITSIPWNGDVDWKAAFRKVWGTQP